MVSKYDLLKHFAKLGFKIGAEIGVSQGYFSEAMFKNIPNLKLYCVDIWKPYKGNRWSADEPKNEAYFDITKQRLSSYNAVIMREMSMDAVKKIPFNSLDFVFIDGNHSFDYVMEDLIEWSKRVRSGGIISGDDYYKFKGAGVIEAVNAYTQAHGVKFQLTDPYSIKAQDRGFNEQPCFYWVKP